MIIDLTALLTGEASTIDIEFDFTPDMGEEAPMALGCFLPSRRSRKGQGCG